MDVYKRNREVLQSTDKGALGKAPVTASEEYD